MSKERDLLQRVVGWWDDDKEFIGDFVEEIRNYLAEPMQDEAPVGTLDHNGNFKLLRMVGIPIGQPMKLYEHPAPRPFIRLTDEEIKTLADSGLSPDWTDEFEIYHFVRSVEDALVEKNNAF